MGMASRPTCSRPDQLGRLGADAAATKSSSVSLLAVLARLESRSGMVSSSTGKEGAGNRDERGVALLSRALVWRGETTPVSKAFQDWVGRTGKGRRRGASSSKG